MDNHISFLCNVKFLKLLVKIDWEIVQKHQQNKRCPFCKGKLHLACYDRKLRLPVNLSEPVERLDRYFGLCCANETCRCRYRCESVRFVRGSPNFLGILALVALLKVPNSQRRMCDAAKTLSLSERTLRRWVLFWNNITKNQQWNQVTQIHPEANEAHYLIPQEIADTTMVIWLKVIADLFVNMSNVLALLFYPQNMLDARSR